MLERDPIRRNHVGNSTSMNLLVLPRWSDFASGETTPETTGSLAVSRDHDGRAVVRRPDVRLAAIAIVGVGLVVRIAAARGDLWTDEVWTLALVSGLDSAFDVFWKISHANNHYLNSIWMFVLGPFASERAYRLPALVFGGLAVAAAVRLGLRSGPIGGIVSGGVFAVSYPMVNFGSEARGYSGLILATLLAVDAVKHALANGVRPESADDRSRFRRASLSLSLGLAVGFGTLCHLTMLLAAGILFATAAVLVIRDPGALRPRGIGMFLVRMFGPAAILALPAIAAMLAGLVLQHGMTLGENSHAPGRLVSGFSGMLGAALGLPSTLPAVWPLVASAGLLGAAGLARLLSPVEAVAAVVGLVLVPFCVFAADVPNTEYPRYFLVCGVLLTIVLSGAAGRALGRPVARWPALACLIAFGAGQLALDARLLVVGRGDASHAVALMAEAQGVTYAADFKSAHEYPIDYYAFRQGVTIKRVRAPFDCAALPAWFIAESNPDTVDVPDHVTLGPDACRATFKRRFDTPTSPLSGSHWSVYRRS